MTLTQDVCYFVLEDPIPAGTEGVNTSLLTTSQKATEPSIQQVYRNYNPFWYWGWWWFDRTEMRDEQVNLYADFLPHGTYVYTYQKSKPQHPVNSKRCYPMPISSQLDSV